MVAEFASRAWPGKHAWALKSKSLKGIQIVQSSGPFSCTAFSEGHVLSYEGRPTPVNLTNLEINLGHFSQQAEKVDIL